MVHAKKEDKILKIATDPSKSDLAWFGLIFFAAFALIGLLAGGGLRVFSGKPAPTSALVFWGIAVGFTVIYYAVPPLRKKMYIGFMYVVYPIGFIMSHVILGAVYFLLFTPVGFFMRLTGYDPLGRKFQPQAATYWTEHRTGQDAPRYFRQF